MRSRHCSIFFWFVLAAIFFVAPAGFAAEWWEAHFAKERSRIQHLFNAPIRDTSICRGPDGTYYLTGTLATDGDDFQNNDGVHLWRSETLGNWEGIGQVWSVERDATGPQSQWQKERRLNPENPDGPLVRGMTSPEVHYIRDTFWITYSMNGQGTGLLKSTSGEAQGPYTDLGCMTECGQDASLFEDDDGTVYWVMGEGWIARMKPDMSGLAERPRLVQPGPFAGELETSPRYAGMAGAFITRANGKYFLCAADVWGRLGCGCWDTFVAWSDDIYGPYSTRHLMVAHGGQTTLFQGPEDRLWATFSPRDNHAVFQDRPAAVPLEWGGGVLYGRGTDPFPRKPPRITTEFGPWDRIEPIADVHIRDLQFSAGPDGYFYLTGSGCDPDFSDRIMVFRSRDMAHWEEVDVQFDFMSIPGVTREDYRLRFEEGKGLSPYYMDSEIYYADNTFIIFTSLYGMREHPDAFNGPMMLRSTTGKPEGPYRYVCRAMSQASMFLDDDGSAYLFANGTLVPFKDDFSGFDSSRRKALRTTSGTRLTKGDVATNLKKIHGKYVVFGTGWFGGGPGENHRIDSTYDWVYFWSDNLEGPYHMVRQAYPMAHCGHSCPPVKGPDGHWYGLFFGNDSTGPWWNQPGVLVFDVRLEEGEIRVELLDEVP